MIVNDMTTNASTIYPSINDTTQKEISGSSVSSAVEVKSDLLTLSYETQQVSVSDNYTNYSKVTGSMPSYCFEGRDGYELIKKIEQKMLSYYQGNCTKDEVKEYFKSTCKELLKFYAQQSKTSGSNIADNKKIVLNTYQVFQKYSVGSAFATGEQYAYKNLANSNSRESYDFVYYDADLYYASEEMKQVINDVTNEMANEWGLGNIDTSAMDQINEKCRSGSYNDVWSSIASASGCGSMIDKNLVPPKDFKFFYQENRYCNVQEGSSLQLGTLLIGKGNQFYRYDVPFTMPTAGTSCIQFYNAGDLLSTLEGESTSDSINGDAEKSSQSYAEFLKNFNIYTRWYDDNYIEHQNF